MDYKRFGKKYVVRIDKGEEVVESLKNMAIENNITLASVSGIGAADRVTIGFFDTSEKKYYSKELKGDYEITSLAGNISTMDEEVYLHLHVTLGDTKHKAFGGHLNEAFISGTCEVIVDVISGEIDRRFDPKVGLNTFSFDVADGEFTEKVVDTLKKDLDGFDLSKPTVNVLGLDDYRRYFRLDFPGIQHSLGYIKSSGYDVFAQAFIPKNPIGSVVYLHGLFEHSGHGFRLYTHLLNMGYAVYAMDLPGHGMSSGERNSVNSFNDYFTIFDDFLDVVKPHAKTPMHAIAFSTGNVPLIKHLLDGGKEFDKVIMVSPLVRSFMWSSSQLAFNLLEPILGKLPLPKWPRFATSDKDYVEILRNDPLVSWNLNVDWVGRLYSWNEENVHYPTVEKEIMLMQSENDTVVDRSYNTEYLKKHFGKVEYHLMKNSRHQVLNERTSIRNEAFGYIEKYLNGER